MKRSATWSWIKVWYSATAAVALFLGLNIIFGGAWDWIGSLAVYVMLYAMGRQHQTEAFGIRMIEFIKKHHQGEDTQPWT